MRRALALPLCCLLLPLSARAHHGKDFLVVESYEIPHPGDLYALGSGAWQKAAGKETSELEPAVLAGIFPRVAGELHGHFAREPGSGSFHYESVAPALHVQLTGPESGMPIDIGASIEHEFGAADAPDATEGRLILEKGFDGFKLSLNTVVERVQHQDTAVGYAAGARYEFDERLAVGAESQGSFDTGANESLAGVYWEPAERLTLKFGAGARLGSAGPDASVRVGLVGRF